MELVAQCDDQVYDKPARSLSLAQDAFQLAEELEDDSLIAVTLNRIGSAQWSLGNEIEALEKIQQSLQIAETRGYEALMAKNYGNIGNVYSAAGLDLDAIGYYRLELSIQEKLDKPFRLFAINNNIGKAFLDVDFYDSAHHYLNKASQYLNENFIHLHSILYFNLAEAFFKQKDWNKADSLLKITLENAETFNSTRGIIRANQLTAELERIKGNKSKALEHAKIATKLAEESRVKELIYICNKTLSNCYSDLNDYQNAFIHDQIYESYLDSVQNVSTVNELELLSYYQRLFRLRVLEEKNTLNKQMAEQRQFIIYGLVGVILFAIFMISLIIRRGQQINRQTKKLEELNAFKNKIFAIVSHDLKSPIQAVSAAIEMFQEKLISKQDIETHLPEIRSKTSQLLDLLNNIFQWAEGQMEGEALKKEEFQLIEVVKNLEEEISEKLKDKEIAFDYDKKMSLTLHSNPSIVRIVLRNLVINAIKFSHKNSKVILRAFARGNETILEVEDQGIGMKPAMLKNLFTMELGSMPGTSGERGNGLGLALCYDFIRELGGRIEAESEEGVGSTFRVYFKDQDVLR